MSVEAHRLCLDLATENNVGRQQGSGIAGDPSRERDGLSQQFGLGAAHELVVVDARSEDARQRQGQHGGEDQRQDQSRGSGGPTARVRASRVAAAGPEAEPDPVKGLDRV